MIASCATSTRPPSTFEAGVAAYPQLGTAVTNPDDATTTKQADRLPTVAEPVATPDTELTERHDQQDARSWDTGEPASDIYLGELGVRMQELRAERRLRILLAATLAIGVVLIITLSVLILAL